MATSKRSKDHVEKMKNGRRATYDLMAKMIKDGINIDIEKKPPPMPTNRFNIPEVNAYREKLFKAVDKTPMEGAFLIPTVLKTATQRYLKEKYNGEFRFKWFTIADNKDITRVYKHKQK